MRALCVALLCCLMLAPVRAAVIPAPPQLAATAWILLDADSGRVLAEANADARVEPASLTKMMTSYILSWEMAQGRLKGTDLVTVSQNAWARNFPGSSLMWIEVGKQVSLDDLHRGIIISSGNDASVAVAEHLAGDETAFASVMNQHAERLGMSGSHFMNSHGLPHAEHYTTARDMALLSRAIIRDFPEDYALYKEKSFVYNNINQPNRNRLLWRDPSVDGLKTGHTEAAGYCLAASAQRDGMRLIAVVMGTASEEARVAEIQKLFTYGFRFYETFQLYDAQQTLSEVPVWGGSSDRLALGTTLPVHLTVARGQRSNIQAQLDIERDIHAPVAAGDVKGSLKVLLGEDVIQQEPLVALHAVEEAGWFGRLWDSIRLFFRNLFSAG